MAVMFHHASYLDGPRNLIFLLLHRLHRSSHSNPYFHKFWS